MFMLSQLIPVRTASLEISWKIQISPKKWIFLISNVIFTMSIMTNHGKLVAISRFLIHFENTLQINLYLKHAEYVCSNCRSCSKWIWNVLKVCFSCNFGRKRSGSFLLKTQEKHILNRESVININYTIVS